MRQTNGRQRESHRRHAIRPERPTPLRRCVHFADAIWRYVVGRGGLTIQRPTGEKTKVDMSTFTGWSWYDIEKARWKGGGPNVAPSDVRDYIERHMMPGGIAKPPRPSKSVRDLVQACVEERRGQRIP